MSQICRIGDSVIGQCHGPGKTHPRQFTGVWQTGSSSSMADGRGIVRVGDIGSTDCGHSFRAINGSGSATADGQAVHCVGHEVQVIEGGTGVSITGSPTSVSV